MDNSFYYLIKQNHTNVCPLTLTLLSAGIGVFEIPEKLSNNTRVILVLQRGGRRGEED